MYTHYQPARYPTKRPATEHPMAPTFKNPRGNENKMRPPVYHKNKNYQNKHRYQYYRQPFTARNRQQAPPQQFPPSPLMSVQLAPPTFEVKPKFGDVKPKIEENNGITDILKYLPLLKSLQNKGLLSSSSSEACKPTQPSEKPQIPIASENDIWNQLSHPNQKIRDQSKIDALLQKRADCCERCGLKLDNSGKKSKLWKDHMDYHFEINMGELLQRKPVHIVKKQPMWSGFLTGMSPPVEQVKVETVDTEDVESVSSVKECSVCCEKFDEYYDDEEETWRFKDSMRKNGQIIHKTCSDNCAPQPKPETPVKFEIKSEVKPEIIYI